MEVKIFGVQLLRMTRDRGDLIKKIPITVTMSNSWKPFLQQAAQSGMIRSGRLDEISWRMIRKVRSGHENILLDGTAQSARY